MFDSANEVADKPVAYAGAASIPGITTYQRYVLGILFLCSVLSFADQQMINILVEPIKREFGASDTQMGLLTGFMFVLFYALLSLPIARFADRSSRRNILSIAVALWSLMTAFCGLSANFWQLAAARFGVGIGEAGGGPSTSSMLADYFPPQQRGFACGVMAASPSVGILISLCGGAIVATHYGWRMAFLLLGIPGVLLAIIVRLTIREPARGRWDMPQAGAESSLSMREVLARLWNDPSIRALALASSAVALFTFGAGAWMPSFFIRVHGLTLMQAGIALGVGGPLGGIAGSILGGMLADRLALRNHSWQLRVSALGCLLALPIQALMLLWPRGGYLTLGALQLPIVFIWVPVGTFFLALMYGPAGAALQNLVPPAIRTQANAVFFLLTSAIGMGLGPLGIGVLSDLLTPTLAENAMRYGLLISLFFILLGGLLYWRAGELYATALKQRRDPRSAG